MGTSPAVCRFPRKLLWRGWCWFLFKLLKKIKAPVALLSKHSLFSFSGRKKNVDWS
jgi:hypothetical protein